MLPAAVTTRDDGVRGPSFFDSFFVPLRPVSLRKAPALLHQCSFSSRFFFGVVFWVCFRFVCVCTFSAYCVCSGVLIIVDVPVLKVTPVQYHTTPAGKKYMKQ